ncbi:RecT family recombinase [Microbacterium sp.]|uniref:RecT family recombinase n=1 Tax=Microbacterium sp. TaxID=51671 RepID=UPI0039E642A4
MSGALATLPTSTDRADWTDEEAAVVEAAGLVFTHTYGALAGQKVLAPRAVIAKFRHTVERTGLDPLVKQIYCIGRASRDGVEWAIQTAIDGFRLIAERSRQYAGQEPAQWLTPKGEWVDAFVKELHGDHPLAARVTVHRHDWDIPLTAVATWDEYAQTKHDGKLTSMWAQRGPGQLAKCAEALALRKAFPQDLSGLYTDDEMGNATAIERDDAPSGTRRPARGISTVASRARAAAAEATEPQEATVDASTDPVGSDVDVSELRECERCHQLVEHISDGLCDECIEEVKADEEEQA